MISFIFALLAVWFTVIVIIDMFMVFCKNSLTVKEPNVWYYTIYWSTTLGAFIAGTFWVLAYYM